MTVTFKKCKLFDKTFSKAQQPVKNKFKEFVKWKEAHPHEKFGGSDYPFVSAGALQGYWHAKLNFDVSIIYRVEKDVVYLYGVFSHDDAGTGQPANINKQQSLKSKLDNQVFESNLIHLVKMVTQGIRNVDLDIKEVKVQYKKHPGARKKECFNNAFKALENEDTFVLGYVFLHGVPIEHAWIKKGETYYDVTLDPKDQQAYYSVAEFSFDEVMKYVDKFHSAPSLFDMNRFKASK